MVTMQRLTLPLAVLAAAGLLAPTLAAQAQRAGPAGPRAGLQGVAIQPLAVSGNAIQPPAGGMPGG